MLNVTVGDFLSQWIVDFRIEDGNESVCGEFRENLSDELKNKVIHGIKIERTIWTKSYGEMVITI